MLLICLPPLEYNSVRARFICLAQLSIPAFRTNSLAHWRSLIKRTCGLKESINWYDVTRRYFVCHFVEKYLEERSPERTLVLIKMLCLLFLTSCSHWDLEIRVNSIEVNLRVFLRPQCLWFLRKKYRGSLMQITWEVSIISYLWKNIFLTISVCHVLYLILYL